MSRSIEQVEALVSKAVRYAKSEKELSIKGLNFGRWWSEVGEYEKASKWITRYLVVYDKDAKAHKLLGEIYEKLDNTDAALACYKSSLRVKPQQYELMLKVAEMHINPGPTQNPNRAQVWLDKAAVALPNHPQVYKLKMELFLAQEAPSSKLEETILQELKKRPTDPSLYIEYVAFLKNQERLDEAFAFAQKTDHDFLLPKIVEKDLEWNQCLVDICQDYAEHMSDDNVTDESIKAYSLLLISLCRYIWLCFEQEKYDDALEYLVSLDTSLLSASNLNQDESDNTELEWEAVLNESKGQLYWLSAIAIIHQAMQNNIQWEEGTKLAATCYAVSLSFPMADISATWASWSKNNSFPEKLKTMSGFRLSQSAHMMYNLASVSRTDCVQENEINEREWLRDVTDNYCTDEGRNKVFQYLFGEFCNPETSMLNNDDTFSRVSSELIPEDILGEYDISAAVGSNLQTWIWMGLQWKQNFDNSLDPFPWISAAFSELQLAPSSSVKYGNVWNLFRLDVESFIMASVLYAEKAGSLWRGTKSGVDENALDMSRLPLPLCRKLVTDNQNNWWEAACKLHNKKNTEKIFNANQVKATLRHGLEAIRGLGNHGLQLLLITGLAKHFAAKAYMIDKSFMGTSSIPWLAYQRRAAHYWMLALPLLQAAAANKSRRQTEPKDRLFPNTLNDPTVQEARGFMSEVYMCNGGLLVQEGDLKRALEMYGKADTPHASFCEALIYKQLLENCDKEGSITGSNNKRREAYQRKYTSRLELTLNRLQREPDEELLRRTESLLHECISPSISRTFKRESEPKHLFEDTMPRHLPHVANHTVNSEVDDSVIPTIPSKQSTPKNEVRPQPASDKNEMMVQLTHNMSTLASVMSSLQLQFNEKMNKIEQSKSNQQQAPAATEGKKEEVLGAVCDQLAKLTTIVSGLQEKKEDAESAKLQKQQEAIQLQLQVLQDQVNRTQFGTPVAPGRTVHLTQSEGQLPPGSPMSQVYNPYQPPVEQQIGSPMPGGSPYYNMLPYQQGYLPQSPAMAAMYAQQGFILPQSQYGPRLPQQILDSRGMPSPAHTPPMHIVRPQQPPTNTRLPMSKEAADALSIRFQASLSGNVSPNTINMSGRPGSGDSSSISGQQPQSTQSAFTLTGGYDQRNMSGSTSPFTQGRLPLSSSEPILGDKHQQPQGFYGRQPGPGIQIPGLGMHPREPEPDFMNMPNLTTHSHQQKGVGLDESYLPPDITNTAQQQQPGGTSVLKSILLTERGGPQAFQPTQQQPEINYPKHINFPEKKDQTTPANEWNFKFQTPEEMDRANNQLKADEEAEDAETSHNDAGPHFEPIVTLPEVEVRTGEEDEEAVFSERAKLFRWHEGQWKERGVGIMKILKHKETGKYRLLMRRDQILKICCNHYIGKDLDLKPMPKSNKSWVWHATDFAEEESKQEGFAIKFQTPELASSFKDNFIEGREANTKISGGTPVHPTVKPQFKEPPKQSASDVQVTSTNDPSTVSHTASKTSVSDTVIPKFAFAFPKPSAAAVNLAAMIAGSPQKPITTCDTEPVKAADDANEDEPDDVYNESGDGPHFEPIIKLPDKVETKTGEEDEEILYCHRVKLYRYVDKQWKERGVGEMKILHNKNNNKCRIVMRREQVLKLCANHYIIPEMKLSQMGNSDKAWTWTALDNSDTDVQPKPELLAVRFKTSEEASDFAKIIDQAKDIIQGKEVSFSTSTTMKAIKSNVPTFTSTTTPTPPLSFKLSTITTSQTFTTPSQPTNENNVPPQSVNNASKGDLGKKKEAGMWECPECYSPNVATDSKCPCCDAPNPSAPTIEEPKSSAPSSSPVFRFQTSSASSGISFGLPQGSKPLFGGQQTTQESKPVFGNQPTMQESKPVFGGQPTTQGSKPVFGGQPTTQGSIPVFGSQQTTASDTSKTSGFSFVSSGFSFGENKSTSDTSTQRTPIFGEQPSKPEVSQPTQPQISNTGLLKVTKQPGKWNCATCYAENEPSDTSCPCCGEGNPSEPQAAKADANVMKPGLFDLSSKPKSTFSFGVPSQQTSTSSVATDISSSVISPPKFTFGKSMATGGAPFSFGLSSQPQQGNLFSNLGSIKQNSTSPGQIAKPRFPSVGDEENSDEDEYEDDDEEGYTDESDDESSEDNSYRENNYTSPMNRHQQQREEHEGSDSDVICLGEVLPSEELQKKAENLMLPKHFYNFIKEGEEDETGDDSETGDEKTNRAALKESSLVVTSQTTISATSSTTFGFSSNTTTSTTGFGFGSFAGATSFGDLVKSNSNSGFGKSTGGWVGMPEQKPLFANLNKSGNEQDGDEYHPSEENADIHFEPIVKLPEKVKILTGEEDEEELYSQRCKLYRYNKPTSEWKERGVGELKLKRNLKNGRIRIIMRREQVLKVCANHCIRPGMTLDVNKNSDRAWTWTAMDFSESEEPTMEIFTVRFKNAEQAMEFKAKYDECQLMLLDVDPMTPCKASSMRTKELSDKAEKMKNELKFFKDKFSEPSNIDAENNQSSPTESGPAPMMGSLTPLVQQHTQSLREKSATSENKQEDSILGTPQKSGFTLKKSEDSFATSNNKFSFQPKMENTQQTPTRQHQSRQQTTSEGSDDPQTETDVDFEPIYKLPEHVDLITGEEDEQILFGNRAKLYMFHKETVQWKERGLGDVKILQNLSNFKVRVVMRREQVLKVCLNHAIQVEIKVSFKEKTSPKTLIWTATDFSDDDKPEGETLQFALRFKDPDTASVFKQLWEEGAKAAASKTLLEPDESAINTSTIKPGITSPGPTSAKSPQSPQSPVDQPKPSFSFANVPSPFEAKKAEEGPHNVMGFVFGKTTESGSTPTTDKFQFDCSKLSFNFSATSTPQMGSTSTPSSNFFTPPQNLPEQKTGAQKSLFTDKSASDNTVNSNLYVTSSETFTQASDQTVMSTEVQSETGPTLFSGTGKGYKPSPLAANFSSQGSLSVQSGNKFQFKPGSNETTQKITDATSDASKEDKIEDDDVVFMWEAKPTEDQRKRAEKLLLPPTFFLFENKTLDFDEKLEDEKEERILQYIKDRDSGKLQAKQEQSAMKTSGSGDTAKSIGTKSTSNVLNGTQSQENTEMGRQSLFGGGMGSSGGFAALANNGADFASFADMASGVQNVGFKKDPSFQFPGAGQVMFQQKSNDGNEDQDPTSFTCDAQFKPVLDKLPPLVKIKTGEEDEEILFKERCKLYRYDKDLKQWKERGVGDLKILFNDQHNLYRVVMRREQVLKVCANHIINETTEPKHHLGSLKTCTYFTMDYTDGPTPKPEQFAIRFKKEDLCRSYMDKIEEVKELQQNESSC